MDEVYTILTELVADAEAKNRAVANELYAALCYVASCPSIKGAQAEARRALDKRNRADV